MEEQVYKDQEGSSFPEKGNLNKELWKNHVAACKKSKKSIASYCRRYNLDYKKFLYWKKKFEIRKHCKHSRQGDFTSLVPVNITDQETLNEREIIKQEKSSYSANLPDPIWLASFLKAFVSQEN